MVTGVQQFGTIDLNTGVFNKIGAPESVLLIGLGETTATGSTVYGSDRNGQLYTVNTSTGALSAVGSATSGLSISTFGSTLTGLYAVDLASHELLTFNTTTGAATKIGFLGILLLDSEGLSTNSSTLYFAGQNDLYTVDTTTGAATLVGSMGATTFVNTMITEGTTLYGGGANPSHVDTINTTNGTATTGPVITPAGSVPLGFAATPVVTETPEPATISWLLAGLLAGGGWIRRRRLSR